MSVEAVIQPVSATPVVVLTVVLVLAAVVSVVLISFLFYWRSGRR
ncbi:MAG TPA: hypothetical protein VFH58_01555 [Acidimicrobiales bacterium]|nr:hypothetical protein [Acidimicrobiales bacterium]